MTACTGKLEGLFQIFNIYLKNLSLYFIAQKHLCFQSLFLPGFSSRTEILERGHTIKSGAVTRMAYRLWTS